MLLFPTLICLNFHSAADSYAAARKAFFAASCFLSWHRAYCVQQTVALGAFPRCSQLYETEQRQSDWYVEKRLMEAKLAKLDSEASIRPESSLAQPASRPFVLCSCALAVLCRLQFSAAICGACYPCSMLVLVIHGG